MWKAALAGTAALAIVGSSLVIAQERGRPGGFGRFQPSTGANGSAISRTETHVRLTYPVHSVYHNYE